MALTLERWVFFALAACAAVLIALWPTPATPPDFLRLYYSARAADIVRGDATRTQSALTVLERRDAILDSLHRARTPPGALQVVFQAPMTRETRAAWTEAFDSVAAGLRPSAPTVTTLLVITTDSAPNRRSVAGYWYLLPEATDHHTCLALHFTDPNAGYRLPTSTDQQLARSWITHALGPCAFYFAFGQPGAEMERWLREHNYRYAWAADWRSSRGVPSTTDRNRWGLSRDVPNDLRNYMTGNLEWGGNPLPVRACAHGDLSQCRTVLTLSDEANLAPLGSRYSVAHWGSWWTGDESTAGVPAVWSFLSDLVRFAGRDRFERFWRSTLPRDSAFAAAMGMTIDDYAHRWLHDKFPAARYGPNVAIGSVVLGLGIIAATILATGLYAGRRQVG